MHPELRANAPSRFLTRAALKVETRAEGDGPAKTRVTGHAAVYNQWTTLYEGRYWTWREILRPGCFKNALAEKQDVRELFNHDGNFILGRTKSGTLSLTSDDTGLLSDCEPPDTQTIRDLVIVPCQRGDIDGMSFAFMPRRGAKIVSTEDADGTRVIDMGGERVTLRYEGDMLIEEREILDADLFDVSVVTFPQYDGTDVAVRAALAPDLLTRAKEMDVPHKRSAPHRDSLRRWLSETPDRASQPA
jgi:uncharacterized protein